MFSRFASQITNGPARDIRDPHVDGRRASEKQQCPLNPEERTCDGADQVLHEKIE
jgi:hypothetical protein